MSTGRSSYLVTKAFRGFLLASVLTAAASQVGTLIDGLMLARFINDKAMSAINIISPVNQVFFALSILIGTGGSMLAGMAIGNHDRVKASRLFSTVTTSVVTVGVILGLAALIMLRPLTELLCPDIFLQGYTSEYLRIILMSAPVYMLMVVTQLFVTLDGAPKRVTTAVCVSMVTNLTLDYIFIVICGWAMTGAAIATAISYIAAIVVLLPHFRKPETLDFRLPDDIRMLGGIMSMGLPFGVATALIAVQLLGNNLVAIHYLGTPGIVTLSICLYMLMFSMIILTGTLESFQPVAAILKGAGDNRGVALVLGRAYRFMALCLLLLASILTLFPQWISGLFGISDPATSATVHAALPAYAANIILQCAVYMLIPVYQLYSHKALAFTISFGQPLLPMLCFWLLCHAGETAGADINPWWGFALGQIGVAIIVAPFALARKGSHMPFILIDTDNPRVLFDVSIRPDLMDMKSAILDAGSWMKDQGIPAPLITRMELGCEEIINNIIVHALASKKHSRIDLRITLGDGVSKAVICDEGKPFNPVETDPGTGIGLLLVKKTCDSIDYEYLFHQNILTLKWKI